MEPPMKKSILLLVSFSSFLLIPAPATFSDILESAPRGFIGDTGKGWDTSGSVQVKVSSAKLTREAIYTIDGSGLDPTGRFHTNFLYPTNVPPGGVPYPYERITPATMWLSQPRAEDSGKPRGGPVRGGAWIELTFDKVYSLGEMWIWNYNENNHIHLPDGIPPYYYWSASGMRDVTIQYSETGGSDPKEWKTIYDGELECAICQPEQPVNQVVDFKGARAKVVVITSDKGSRGNWVEEKVNRKDYLDVGLSEVRFYPASVRPGPQPAD
jgi:hypothetical protein